MWATASGGITLLLQKGAEISPSLVSIAKTSENLGYGVGGIAIFTGLVSDYQKDNGITSGSVVKAGLGVAETVFPVFGLIYGTVDVITGLATGETLTDRIGDGVNNVITTKVTF